MTRLNGVIAKRQASITVVLENVFDPHNVSAVMRTCDAIGIQDVYILNNRIPPPKKWGHRSSSTASKWLTIHQFTEVNACFEAVRKKYEKVYASFLDVQSQDLYEMELTGSMALVFGNESFGISEEVKRHTDGTFRIPQFGVIKSLNISVACAITLYEAMRQKRIAGHYDQPSLGDHESNLLRETWGVPKS